MCFAAAAASENDQGNMNLASNTRAGRLNEPIQSGGHPGECPVDGVALDGYDAVSRLALKPKPIEVFGNEAQLHNKFTGEI